MANSYTVTLASNASAGNHAAAAWPGGKGYFTGEATFGGGSIKLQFMSLNGTWIDYTSGSLSAAGGIIFELPAGQIRAVSATASAVYAFAARI